MKNSLNILMLVTTDLTYDQRIDRIATSLSKVYSVSACGHRKNISVALESRGYDRCRISTWFGSGVFFYLEFNLRLIWKYLFSSYDVVVANDLDTLLAGGVLQVLKPGTELVFDAHELFTEVPELQGAWFKKMIWFRLGKLFIPRAKLRYSVANEISSVLSEKYKSSFEVVANMARYRGDISSQKEEVFTILYQGAVNRGRGLELLVQVMRRLDAQLWIIGDGDILDDLKRSVHGGEVENKIRFWGYQKPLNLLDITHRSHLGVNILDPSSESYTLSLANRFFDYLQAEIPAIHSDLPEYRALISQQEVGALCSEYSVKELEYCIRKFMEDQIYYDRVVEHCRKAKKIWNWERQEEHLLSLYDSHLRES